MTSVIHQGFSRDLFMMQDRGVDSGSSEASRRGGLQPLAPRSPPSSSSRGRSSASASGRPPRLSHRSRAGCWTCRGRKVKCDEQHPRCGPCSRLNRDCDWDHRWNFNDATSTTQDRYSNVTTAGSAVWDPNAQRQQTASSSTRPWDDLPAFAALTSDEERERKAETQRPGTFAVVATPDSFSNLPEYASAAQSSARRPSVQSTQSSLGSPASTSARLQHQPDPNTVVLDRFEETSPPTTASLPTRGGPSKPDIPEGMRNLSIATPLQVTSSIPAASTYNRIPNSDDHLTAHFRQSIVRRLTQPLMQGQARHGLVPGATEDVFELEATRYRPLHHAICALSALNLSYGGRVSLEEALQHYQSALSVSSSPATADDMLSDGVFLRHFLLFVYDICVPMGADHGGDVMWAQHLNHLRSITLQRHQRLGREQHGYILWSICELDMYACLLGSGNCDFASTIIQKGMLPSLEAQIPAVSSGGPYSREEMHIFPSIQRLNEVVVLNAIKVAQHAQQFRTAASNTSPGTNARFQASVSHLQEELLTAWHQTFPPFLGAESPQAGYTLPDRVRYVYEHAFMLHQASMLYLRTSMFVAQRSIPIANQADVNADSERRCMGILALASGYLEGEIVMEHRHAIFPIFMAGVVTMQSDVKIQAINIVRSMERGAIGQNTSRTRQLLVAVCEEQSSGRIVDWLTVARERGLSVVNCGL
ncbi:hypothetical protein LTR56_008238 [Elasticomyces elasticus]|nr:hypothetical protein LTR56_008238 [Elasticomyces elasticus]KAK3661801.1 hypothetical protein LTR22_007384 [Elasticomyces elasticus]KAK4924405.1 hypothetical protein LTR49_008496 [Elasticomyces elasticus]